MLMLMQTYPVAAVPRVTLCVVQIFLNEASLPTPSSTLTSLGFQNLTVQTKSKPCGQSASSKVPFLQPSLWSLVFGQLENNN